MLLVPAGQAQAVSVSVEVTGDLPDGTLTATATVDMGATIQSVIWTQTGGVAVSISPADANTTMVTLGSEARGDYKKVLFHVLTEPPIGPDQLPPNVPLPPEPFPAGLQNRFQVVGLNSFALEEAGLVALKVEVTTDLGEAEVEIHVYKVASDIRNVPIGRAVLLHGKDQASYDWTLTPPPGRQRP